MKTLLEAMHNLKEAKPSILKKSGNRTKNIHYGAENQPAWSEYAVPFDYTLSAGDYEGYITDKKGNRYIVTASYDEKDTGNIAGGTMYYYVYIAYGQHKITLSSYTAVLSYNTGAGGRLINDLKEGMYLEDYLQKNISEVDSVSNIDEWISQKRSDNAGFKSWEYPREWIKENIIGENNDYDERTSLDKRVDKKNKKDFVTLWDGIPVYIENNEVKIANDLNKTKYRYTGQKGYSAYAKTDDYVTVKKGSVLLLDDKTKQRIFNRVTTSGEYDFEITLNDLSGAIFILDELYTVFEINKDKLKPVYREFKDMQTVTVDYSSKSPENKISKLIKEAGMEVERDTSIRKLYKDIQANMMQKEKRGVKDSTVEIVYDYKKHEYRAQADDGYHGKAWVQFPKDLRQDGKRYKVDELIWTGKNYRIKGTPKEI